MLSGGPSDSEMARAFGAAVSLLYDLGEAPVVLNVDGTVVALIEADLWRAVSELVSGP